MGQIFHPRAGFFLTLGAFGLVALILMAIFIGRTLIAAKPALNEPVAQAVPFSHQHHVGQVGLDCRYCHQSVETSAFAGIPPIATCMTCHSQLFTNQAMLAPVVNSWRKGVAQFHWRRVHDLPDFVYFDHSVHVANGVGCVSCHGRIDQMPLTMRVKSLEMQWCLDCHTNPAQHLRPQDHIFDMAWTASDQASLGERLMRSYHINAQRLTECVVCHR